MMPRFIANSQATGKTTAFEMDIPYGPWRPTRPQAPDGTFILRAEPNQALLDLDTCEQLWQFIDKLPLVDTHWPIKHIQIWKSRSKGTHAMLTFGDKVPSNMRVIQAAMGSDPVREILNLLDKEVGPEDVNILFKPADKKTLAALEDAEGIFQTEVPF